MTTLREAAQQALELLTSTYRFSESPEVTRAIRALKAALVEDAMQKFTDVNQELMAALGCDHCNSPLYAATRCRVCGRETPIIEPEIKGDNKPDVADDLAFIVRNSIAYIKELELERQMALNALVMMRDKYGEYARPACDHADAAIKALRSKK